MQTIQTELLFRHDLPKTSLVTNRNIWLLDRCRGKKVLHIGCVDSGMTQHRIEMRELLHDRLQVVSADVVGIDIDTAGISTMQGLGFTKLLAVDISESPSLVSSYVKDIMGNCDVIICGEVLEHVPNYGQFLNGIREVAKIFDASVILTVPNAFSMRSMFGVMAGVEIVHPDHKCYFSWKTLSVLLNQQGFELEEILYYSNQDSSSSLIKRFMKRLFNRTIFHWRPYLSEGLIAVAKAGEC